MKVLIADDDKVLDAAFAAAFRSHGWKTVVAFDAMQALMYAKQSPVPDIILLDIVMPGGSGLNTLERLKAASLTEAIPVVVVTGSEDPQLPAKAKELGAVGFVKKPVDAQGMVDAVERYFKSRTQSPPAGAPPGR